MLDIYLRNLKDVIIDPLSRLFLSLKDRGVSPNTLTLISGVFGLFCVYNSYKHGIEAEKTGSSYKKWKALFYFILNRIFDGIDGAYARMTNQCSDFGGYLDILVDFTIYGLVPIGVYAGMPTYGSSIALCLLEVAFFVNAAGLFMLSALMEKKQNQKLEAELSELKAKKIEGSGKDNKSSGKGKEKGGNSDKKDKEFDMKKTEVTSVKMPPALIEGFESMILFFIMVGLPEYQTLIFSVFCAGVVITILQRL